MKTFANESGWDFDFTAAKRAFKADGNEHMLRDRMLKSVDFIVEDAEQRLFVEVKTFEQSPFHWRNNNRCKYPNCEFEHAVLPELVRKCRDTLMYEWARGIDCSLPTLYVVFLTVPGMQRHFPVYTGELRKFLPVTGVEGVWTRRPIAECLVMDSVFWNKYFPQYPVVRSVI